MPFQSDMKKKKIFGFNCGTQDVVHQRIVEELL